MTAIRIELPLKETRFCCVHRQRRVNTHYFIHFIFLYECGQSKAPACWQMSSFTASHPPRLLWVGGWRTELLLSPWREDPYPSLQLCSAVPPSGQHLTSCPQVHQAFGALPGPFTGKNLCGHHCFILSLQEEVNRMEGFRCRSMVGRGWGWVRGEVRLRTFRPDAPTLCTTHSCENINAHNVSSERFPGTTGGKGKFRDGGGNKTHWNPLSLQGSQLTRRSCLPYHMIMENKQQIDPLTVHPAGHALS